MSKCDNDYRICVKKADGRYSVSGYKRHILGINSFTQLIEEIASYGVPSSFTNEPVFEGLSTEEEKIINSLRNIMINAFKLEGRI